MPIVLPRSTGGKPHWEENGAGIVVYDWNAAENTLSGTFVLAMYQGLLATETGHKIEGVPGELPGTYRIETLTPNGGVFSHGLLLLVPMAGEGAYDVTYDLTPLPDHLAVLGFAPGTRLGFKATGLFLTGLAKLAVSWDNNLYTRLWEAGEVSHAEWGQRIVRST